LGLHRRTVSHYLEAWAQDSGTAPPAVEGPQISKCTTISTAGFSQVAEAKWSAGSGESVDGERGEVAMGIPGRKSRCEPLAGGIAQKLQEGLSAQRIYQDLVAEKGFDGSYESVKRFARKLLAAQPARVWRVECQPGEELQMDFGVGAPLEQSDGKRRRTWVLRAILSYSRKGYSEAVLRQDTETFVRCVENALRHFGGVPLLLNIDNLKAAVLQADWFDPQINPKLAEFCRHYGLHVLPCRPRTPQHKGKVERGIGYVQGNALKGRRFPSLAAQNQFLAHWEEHIADKRIHGTTCKQVAALFLEERPHLQALPDSLFACYQEARRTVSRDSFVEVQRAFYEVPPEYIGRQVWVRWESRCVRIFNERLEQVQMHTRLEAGKFSRILGAAGLSAPVLSSCRWWVERAGLLGEHCAIWAQRALDARGPEALRSLMGLCGLSKKHTAAAIDTACGKALEAGVRRFKDIVRLLGEPAEQTRFAFTQSHRLIRDLSAYSEFIAHQQTHEPANPDPNQDPT